ncbi:MAG: hypothetical protein M0P58_12110 [Bacteroidales bacterium]|nr:hypothetical protein [Bacteroidales bacterium]
MKSTRQRLTHLIKKINDLIPDGPDIFEFPGISKQLIVDSLNESYDFLGYLENFNDKFETIFLKRKLSDYIHSAHELLDSLEDKNNFNKFLDIIFKIHSKIKETFIAVAKEPIRTESEIKKAKEELEILTTNIEDIRLVVTEIEKHRTSSDEFVSDLQQRQLSSIENSKIIDTFLAEIQESKDNLDETESEIISWKERIKIINEDIALKSKKVEDLTTSVDLINDRCSSNLVAIKDFLEKQAKINKQNEDQQEEIRKTIEDSNRLGMAGSFKKRKDELTWPLRFWTFATIITLLGLIAVAFYILAPMLKGNFELKALYVKIPIFASCVWLGWFCAKQYGFTIRIREDYAFKYAVSMAFEGYKNETKEIDEEHYCPVVDF